MDDSQHQTNDDKAPAGARRAPPPASDGLQMRRVEAPSQRAKVYLDRSRDFSTVHGDRTKDDPHHRVNAFQNGLPFNASDELIYDHPDVQDNEANRAKADRLIARAQKLLDRARSSGVSDEDDDDEGSEEVNDEIGGAVDLGAWARGVADWPWQEITNAIARRFSKRIKDKHDALELLLTEKVVQPGQLSKQHRAIVDRGY